MKVIVTKPVEIEVSTVLIQISPRHIGDTDDDEMPTDMPLLEGGTWTAFVIVDSGQIKNWPEGRAQSIHVKACDTGTYVLYDSNQVEQGRIEQDYVPNQLIPGSYGDYVELEISGGGVITNWPEHPCISDFFKIEED